MSPQQSPLTGFFGFFSRSSCCHNPVSTCKNVRLQRAVAGWYLGCSTFGFRLHVGITAYEAGPFVVVAAVGGEKLVSQQS